MCANQVRVLQEGYSNEIVKNDETSFVADCTVSLILGNFSPILVDTSGPWNKDKLIAQLKDSGTSCDEVETVVCTHGHSDHVGNLNLFPNAKLIVGFDICTGNVYESFDFRENGARYYLNEDVFVIPTPGHTCEDVSVVVKHTNVGTVVVAGDIFENENDFSMWQSLSTDILQQRKNRLKILKLADYIVPGHGKMFQVTETYKQSFMVNVQKD